MRGNWEHMTGVFVSTTQSSAAVETVSGCMLCHWMTDYNSQLLSAKYNKCAGICPGGVAAGDYRTSRLTPSGNRTSYTAKGESLRHTQTIW